MTPSTVHHRYESFTLTDGCGLLRIAAGAPHESSVALFFNDKPVALCWPDNAGTVAQMLVAKVAPDVQREIAQMRRVADGNLDIHLPISSQIYPLLQLFEIGEYHLVERRADASGWDLIEHLAADSAENFYPFDSMIMTQPSRTLSEQRIAHFSDCIARGHLPIAFLAGHGFASFVIDGHHKLQAYRRANVPPRIIEIGCADPTPVTRDEVRRFLTPPLLSHYDACAAKAMR